MAGFGKPLDLRLFLEGIEVPVVSAQVTCHTNGPSAASVQVVPLDEVLRLKPRTMVHLFFLEKPARPDVETGVLENYRLLFTGEIVGFAWMQKANARGVVLQCLDFSNYWDAAVATVMNYGPNGNSVADHSSVFASNKGVFDNLVGGETQQLVNWLKQRPQTPGLENVSGLAGGVIRALEGVSGIDGFHRGVNDFFTVGELRARILAQICAEENDQTALKVLDEGFFFDWIKQNLQVLGEEVSFRQVIQLLFRYIFYDFVPNPAAKYDPPSAGRTIQARKNLDQAAFEPATEVKTTAELRVTEASLVTTPAEHEVTELRSGQRPKTTLISQDVDPKTARLKSHILRPDCWFVPPPRCNVFFPEFYTDLSYDRTFITEATRMLTQFHISLVGANDLLDISVLAPAMGKNSEVVLGTGDGDPIRQLMKHEYHTGIIGRVERIPNTLQGVQTGLDGKGPIDRDNPLEGAKQGWANKVSLFTFFKERFASRQASVSGRFNPYVVCGFPGLIIKRPFISTDVGNQSTSDRDLLELIQDPATAQSLGAPSQILGMIHSVSHNLNQDGGTTSISMNYVREHLAIDDEFLGVFSKSETPVQKRVRSVLRFSEVQDDANLLRLLVEATPQLKARPPSAVSQRSTETTTVDQPRKVFDVTSQSYVTTTTKRSVSRTKETKKMLKTNPYVRDGSIEGLDRGVRVPSSTTLIGKPGRISQIMGVEVLDENVITLPDGRRVFGAVAIYEDVDLPGSSSLAVEEIIRPNWFSPAYENKNIAKSIYQPFFGCGSIIDNVQIKSASPSFDTNVVDMDLKKSKSQLVADLKAIEGEKAGASIERAVNLLSYLYGIVKEKGLDVEEFTTQYTYRPIAGMSDILGYNVRLDINGTTATPGPATANEPFKVGFHTMAVNQATASRGRLVGLLDDPTVALPRMNKTGVARPPAPEYDVRNEKFDRVAAYRLALDENKGFRG